MPKAPRRCPAQGCDNLIRHTRYCPEHTAEKAWSGPRTESSRVTSEAAWRQLRVVVLERDGHQCQIKGPTCTGIATQVDHIVPVAQGGSRFDPDNSRAACPECNGLKARTTDRH